MKFFKAFLITSLLTSQAFSADLDLKNSNVSWKGKKVTGEHYGKIYFKSGSINLDGETLKGGEFVIDMNSFTVDDLSGEWAEKFKTHLKSKDFFTVEKFPTASLKIQEVKGKSFTANLTIKGKTNPVSVKYTKDGKKFTGTLIFDRTKFDMIYGSGDFFKGLGDKAIYNDVELTFNTVIK